MKNTNFIKTLLGFILLFSTINPCFAQQDVVYTEDDWSGWNFQFQGLCYHITNDTLHWVEVTCSNPEPAKDTQVNYIDLDSVVVPSIVYDNDGNAYTVVGIGYCAFFECFSLRKIVLPNRLHYINMGAFARCVNLECIKMPKHLGFIGNTVFENCESLKKKPKFPARTYVSKGVFAFSPFE